MDNHGPENRRGRVGRMREGREREASSGGEETVETELHPGEAPERRDRTECGRTSNEQRQNVAADAGLANRGRQPAALRTHAAAVAGGQQERVELGGDSVRSGRSGRIGRISEAGDAQFLGVAE